MKNLLRWVGASALALLASPAFPQSLIPNCRNTGGSYIPCDPVILVDKNGIIIDSTNPLPIAPPSAGSSVTARGGPSIATAQVSVGTTATLIAAARTGRQKIMVTLGAANDCFFGGPGVTTATGLRVKGVDGATVTLDTGAALYGACVATTSVSEAELF